MNILIIDDERLARQEMTRQIGILLPSARTMEATCVSEARELLMDHSFDCVLLDLEMPGMHGMDFLPELSHMGTRVIIVTGYEKHALRSYDYMVADYLLKPVEQARLAKAFARLRNAGHATRDSDLVLFNDQNHCWPVKLSEVLIVEASGSYVTVHAKGRPAIVLSRNLKEVQPLLDDRFFIRANRSQIVRLDCLGSIRKLSGGLLSAVLDGHGDIIFSRRQAAAFRARFRF